MTVHPGELPELRGAAAERRAHDEAAADMSAERYGLLAEFDDENDLLHAVREARAAGYTRMDAFTPYPVEGLAELLAPPTNVRNPRDRSRLRQAIRNRDLRGVAEWVGGLNLVALLTLGAGITGGLIGYGLQLWSMSRWYPYLNVGGRPYNSWPYYIPITYELVILFASLTALIGMIVLNGLPRPYHPVFNVPEFVRASQNRLFLLIEAADPRFQPDEPRQGADQAGGGTRRFLESLAPGRVYDATS